jgi:hypothetical protein
MGYRIDFAVREDTLRAVVSGGAAAKYAGSIARDISEQAKREARNQLLIDLRRLNNRVGTLGQLLTVKSPMRRTSDFRVAVIDTPGNDRYYVFHELAAAARGYSLRYFNDPSAALEWLQERRD